MLDPARLGRQLLVAETAQPGLLRLGPVTPGSNDAATTTERKGVSSPLTLSN